MASAPARDRALLDHVGPWTVDDLDVYDFGDQRVEIVDGALLMVPQADPVHNGVCIELIALLRAACPPELVVGANDGVAFRASYRVPDVIVYQRAARARGRRIRPSEIVLAAEVVSPSSTRIDRIDKTEEYASVGIPVYWRVEIDPEPVLVVHALRDGAYMEVATVRGDEAYEATEPFPVTVVPNALLL